MVRWREKIRDAQLCACTFLNHKKHDPSHVYFYFFCACVLLPPPTAFLDSLQLFFNRTLMGKMSTFANVRLFLCQSFAVTKDMKCHGEAEMLHELVRDTT